MFLALVAVLGLWLQAAGAATPDAAGPRTPPLQAAEARGYAEQLAHVVHLIAANYVQPIPRGRLYETALTALYQQAGLPVPASLKAELARALQELPAAGEESEALPPPVAAVDHPVIELVARRRAELGDLETLRGNAGLRLSVLAILDTLDPHSGLVSGEDLRRSRGENLNSGFGFSWSADSTASELRVAEVAIGGPAQRAGIRPGDRLTGMQFQSARLARQPLPPLGLPGLLALAQPGDALAGTLQRTGQPVTLHHQFFQVQAVFGASRRGEEGWDHWLDRERKIAYVRLGGLEHGCADQLAEVIDRLDRDGLKGLVLDLRWSPGGYLNEAVLIARLFVADGLVATVRCRNRQDDQEYRARNDEAHAGFPIVVLINADTSGGSELIAAALKDNGRARLAGQRSRGKASVQSTFSLPLGDTGLKLTTGQFFRPNGEPLQRQPASRPADAWGVRAEPELALPITPDLSDLLKQEYLLYSLRPAASKQVLFLDDPDNDPQRQAALRALLGLLDQE